MPLEKARSPVPVTTSARTTGSDSASVTAAPNERIERGVEGIARLGAIEPQDDDMVVLLDDELVVAHDR